MSLWSPQTKKYSTWNCVLYGCSVGKALILQKIKELHSAVSHVMLLASTR